MNQRASGHLEVIKVMIATGKSFTLSLWLLNFCVNGMKFGDYQRSEMKIHRSTQDKFTVQLPKENNLIASNQ